MAKRIPRPEYPRPRLVRENNWMNLNGEWDFRKDPGNSGMQRNFWNEDVYDMKINVPYCLESKLSGIEDTDFILRVWYRRTFRLTKANRAGRVLLHFGAVDYLCDCWINGKKAGSHQGGYTPFTFDITDLVKTGENTVVVTAFDDVKSPLQPSGKQCPSYANEGCMYTRQTGIWQTVWLEFVPDEYVTEIRLTPDVDNSKVDILAFFNKTCRKDFEAKVLFDGKEVGIAKAKVCGFSCRTSVDIPDAKLWDLENPNLYDVQVTLGEDSCSSYFGMRKIAIKGYAIELNDKPVYQRLVLDQGFYPDGIYTAPSDDDLRKDIELSMAAGFNGARLHMKVFEPRTSYWADKLGYLLWGEYPNWGLDITKKDALNSILPEWLEAVRRDYNSPAIIGWCPLNEIPSNRDARNLEALYDATRDMDPIRLIIDTSGYVHVKTDIYDVHDYEQDPEKLASHYVELAKEDCDYSKVFRCDPRVEHYDGQPYFVSEFGGIRWNIDESDKFGWGYGAQVKDMEDFYKRFDGLCEVLLSNPKMCAYCYTQLTDVFQEMNGIYTFDRRTKFDMNRISASQKKKAKIEE